MAKRQAAYPWQTSTATIELYRNDAIAPAYDLEYSVDYTFQYRHDVDSEELDAEFVDYGPIEYYPVDLNARAIAGEPTAVKLTIADVGPDVRARFDAAIKVRLDETARAEADRQATIEYWNRR